VLWCSFLCWCAWWSMKLLNMNQIFSFWNSLSQVHITVWSWRIVHAFEWSPAGVETVFLALLTSLDHIKFSGLISCFHILFVTLINSPLKENYLIIVLILYLTYEYYCNWLSFKMLALIWYDSVRERASDSNPNTQKVKSVPSFHSYCDRSFSASCMYKG